MDGWPTPRRTVRRSTRFENKAKSLYPPGGSADGRPSFELFERLILRGAEHQFAVQWDELPVSVAAVDGIRHVMTHAVPYFPALIIYGMLMTDQAIEMVDLDVDRDYMKLIADDPDD